MHNSQSTFHLMLLGGSLRVSLIFSSTVCSFCFWAISDCVTSATLSFSHSSFSEVIMEEKAPRLNHNSMYQVQYEDILFHIPQWILCISLIWRFRITYTQFLRSYWSRAHLVFVRDLYSYCKTEWLHLTHLPFISL